MTMVRELVMPKLGLTMTEGVLAEWRVSPGQPFRSGDVLLVVETDKIASEVEADSDGVLIETTIPAGETVAVGTPIARGSADGAGAAPAPQAAAPHPQAGQHHRGQGAQQNRLRQLHPQIDRQVERRRGGGADHLPHEQRL
ncbi:hypothetical protein GAY31_30040, partial [Azospirillum brasilense]|nr:hypothetical protein [Azospirillum brasilense]